MAILDDNKSEILDKNIEYRYQSEYSLIDYFLILWKQKFLILLGSVLPALVVGLIIFLAPREYRLTFTYNQELDEKTFRMLADRFYSVENIGKLVRKLQAVGFEDIAQKLVNARTDNGLNKVVAIEVFPQFVESARLGSFEELQRIKQEKASLLLVSLMLSSEKDISQAALVFRENIEKVMPLNLEKESLRACVVKIRDKMAAIKEAKYESNLTLERKKSTLEKLNKLSFDEPNKLINDNIILQFSNANDNNPYLPLPHQRQATETQIINDEEQIILNNELYNYYINLLKLNEKLLNNMDKTIISDSTLEHFCTSLNNILTEYKDNTQMSDYLISYIYKLENKVTVNIPVTEKPKIYPVTKGTVKKSGTVFSMACMMMVVIAFLRESLKKSKVQVS